MKRISSYIIPVVLFFFAVACSDEGYNNSHEDKFKPVTLTLSLPGDMKSDKSTKALTEAQDQEVKTVDVLAFINDGSGNYLYAYQSRGHSISITGGTGSFQVTLSEHSRQQIFVILANANKELVATSITLNENINTVLPKLTATSANEWDANNNNSGVLRYIPMYCKTPPVIINNTTTTIGRYSLVRMLARFDVRLKSTISNFQLVNACIFNRKDKGYIAYLDANWDGSKVDKPEVPGDVTTTKVNSILYNADAITHRVIRSIYSFEAEGVSDRSQSTAIVVGGYFDYPNNTSKVSYYRIDVPVTKPGQFSGDIIRNHLYDIEIQSVEDEGSTTPEEAFDGEVKVTATITPWNLANQDVIFDGEYNLVLDFNKNTLDFRNIEEDKIITITTTHPSSVSISAVTYSDPNVTGWVTITKISDEKWRISTTSKNYKEKRAGTFTITAGNLNYISPISQRGCGSSGKVELMEIGNNTYNTYLYNDRCWMVENSRSGAKEGTDKDFASNKFGKGGTIIGTLPNPDNVQHYYTWAQANRADNACPPGWHLPTVAEFTEVVNIIMLEPNSTVNQHWTTSAQDAHTGYFDPVASEWREWNEKGYWWCASNDGSYYYSLSHSGGIGAPVTSSNADLWYSVRCVKD